MRILILDDEASGAALVARLRRVCPGAVCACHAALGGAGGAAADLEWDLVVFGPTGLERAATLEVVRTLRRHQPALPILAVGARDGAAPAVAAMKAGASDYVVVAAGDGAAALAEAVTRLVERRAPRPARAAGPRGGEALGGLVGQSAAMARVRELVRLAARTDAPVLVEGETGTGKELVARAVHSLGPRGTGPFVPVNCAAVPEALAESELFGHTRGAFTGAIQDRAGVLQLADRGTLFLDEVEDLSPALQAKLLRVVQDREVRPVGGTSTRRVDVRLVAASNRNLAHMVERGAFRRDLYYRLRVLTVALPPLRERREDLPLLVEHFLLRFNRTHGTRFVVPPASALRPLTEHPWPGNVRELENTLEALCILASATGAELDALLAEDQAPGGGFVADERARILRVLEEQRWNRQRAAAALGISRVTLWRRMERHGIRDPFAAPAGETA